MTILLTGGSGFLGSHIAEQLSQTGRDVRALVRKTSDVSFLRKLPNVELYEGSVDDRDSVLRAAAGVSGIIHAAGLVKARNAEEFRRVNTEGAENVLAAGVANKATIRRFVLVSSLAVAGPSGREGAPVADGAEPKPVTAYGKSKLAAERAALALKDELPITILRPPAIYGPRDREILAFFKAIKVGVLPLTGATSNKLSMIYGGDCASACIRALEADVPSGSVFYVDDGKIHTFADLIAAAEAAIGRRAWLRVPLPRSVMLSAGLASELYGRFSNKAVMLTRDKCNELFEQWVCDGSAARSRLGWEPKVPFAEGVRLTVEWYKSVGWL
jgi:nucleoside-diphosphate-sugar epimerase